MFGSSFLVQLLVHVYICFGLEDLAEIGRLLLKALNINELSSWLDLSQSNFRFAHKDSDVENYLKRINVSSLAKYQYPLTGHDLRQC